MKAQIMKELKADITSQQSVLSGIGHDLLECLKILRAPGHISIRRTTTIQKIPQTVASTELHQALRYGVSVADAENVTQDLRNVSSWLKGRMS